MIRNFLFLLLLIFAELTQLNAQKKSNLADCRKIVVQDSDKRGFDDRDSFALDVDGDGKSDTVTPRTYIVKTKRQASDKTKPKAREIHWIAFDIKTSKGRVINSFFKYNYGTDIADYYVYAFVPCGINSDGRKDLVFYSGDDTTDETIILENKGDIFKVRSRKTEGYE